MVLLYEYFCYKYLNIEFKEEIDKDKIKHDIKNTLNKNKIEKLKDKGIYINIDELK